VVKERIGQKIETIDVGQDPNTKQSIQVQISKLPYDTIRKLVKSEQAENVHISIHNSSLQDFINLSDEDAEKSKLRRHFSGF
jgi:hypothetical protein